MEGSFNRVSLGVSVCDFLTTLLDVGSSEFHRELCHEYQAQVVSGDCFSLASVTIVRYILPRYSGPI